MSRVSSCTTTFVQNILRGNSLNSVCADFLTHVAAKKSNDGELLVLTLVESWLSGMSTARGAHCMFAFGGASVSTKQVLEVVQLLQCESIFCQILFLLPEKRKTPLISALCKIFTNASLDQYCQVRKVFLTQACTLYPCNIIHNASTLSETVINSFLENLTKTLQCSANATSNWPSYILYLFDSISGKSEQIENYSRDTFALLNKHGKEEVEELLHFCKNPSASENTLKKQRSILMELLRNEHYSSFLSKLFPLLSMYTKDFVLAEDNEEVFFKVLLKVKLLFCLLCSGEITCSDEEKLCMAAKLFLESVCEQFNNDDIVKEICNMAFDGTTQAHKFMPHASSVSSQWEKETDTNKKFLLAVASLNNLYYRHEEMLTWLIDYQDLGETNKDIFEKCLTAYTINYGSCDVIERYLSVLHEHNKASSISCLHFSIQQVVIKCVLHLSISSCNRLISSCKQYFEDRASLLWSAKYTRVDFLRALKEVINKLTSDRSDKKNICSLAQLSIVSPYLVLQEVIDRIFNGTLKHTVIKSVLLSVPSLFELERVDEEETCMSPIIVYVKNAYMKHKGRPASSRNVVETVLHIIEVAPDMCKTTLYLMACDTFIVPNLTTSKDVFLALPVVVELLEKLLKQPHIDVLPWKYCVLLCELLLHAIDGDECDSVDIVDKFNGFIKLLAADVTGKFKHLAGGEQKSMIAAVTEMIGKYTWNLSFYFYTFFLSTGLAHQFVAPQSLFDLCECLAGNTFTPFRNAADDEEIEESGAKWMCLFEIAYVSSEAAGYVMNEMEVVVADDEMCNIVEAVTKVLHEYASIGKAKAVMECLENIVANGKIEGVSSYLRDDLCDEVDHHGTCFSMLVLIQSFIMQYGDLEEPLRCQKHDEIQNYMKILHLFLLYTRDVENIQVRSSILLYLFEQLMYTTNLLGHFITSVLALLHMDILIAILDCTSQLDKTIGRERAEQVVHQCRDVLSSDEGDHSAPLLAKLNAAISSLAFSIK